MGHFFIGNWMYVPTFRFPERLALVRACAHALRACAHMMRACAQPCARMRAAMHACMHAVLKKFGPSLLSWSSWSSSSSWPSLLSWPPCRGQEHYLAVACRSPKWAASTNGWTNNLEACQSMDMFRTKSENFRDNPRRCWEVSRNNPILYSESLQTIFRHINCSDQTATFPDLFWTFPWKFLRTPRYKTTLRQ